MTRVRSCTISCADAHLAWCRFVDAQMCKLSRQISQTLQFELVHTATSHFRICAKGLCAHLPNICANADANHRIHKSKLGHRFGFNLTSPNFFNIPYDDAPVGRPQSTHASCYLPWHLLLGTFIVKVPSFISASCVPHRFLIALLGFIATLSKIVGVAHLCTPTKKKRLEMRDPPPEFKGRKLSLIKVDFQKRIHQQPHNPT